MADLQPAVSRQCCHSAVDRPRSSAPRRGDRLLQRPPYLGSATATSSSCPLRACRRRPRSGSLPLDLLTLLFLPSRQGAQPCLPRQVRRWAQDRLSCRRTPVPRTSLTACGTARLRLLAAGIVLSRLGRLLQTAFRRARTCAALSRRLHSSRRYFQQQVGCSCQRPRHFPLARLRPRQQEADHDSGSRRVPAPLPAPPAATRLRAHPQFRLPRQPANARSFFHSAFGCSSHPISQQNAPPLRPRSPLIRRGTVRSAAEPCRLSSASPPRNSSSDLRLISAGAQRESTSPASNLSRASARTLGLCLAFLRMQYPCALPTLRCAAPRPFSLRPATETEAPRQQRQPRERSEPDHPDTNPIVPRGLPSSRCI